GIHFLQGVDDVLVVQGDVGLVQCGAVAGVKGRVPLLVLVAEAHHDQIASFDQRSGADGIDLGRLVITPETFALWAEMIPRGVAGIMVGDRGGKDDIQAPGLGSALDLLTPFGMDFAGQVDFKTHKTSLIDPSTLSKRPVKATRREPRAAGAPP